jgi:hypothetical protein
VTGAVSPLVAPSSQAVYFTTHRLAVGAQMLLDLWWDRPPVDGSGFYSTRMLHFS